MESYNSFIDNINDNFAVPHLQIQRFEEGFYDDMQSFETASEMFPFMWLVPTRITHLENSISQYDIRVYFIDILEKDDSNERDVLSDQQQIARDFTNWIRQNQDNGFELQRAPSSTPVKSVLLDYTAGWYVDLSINVDTEMTDCAIPFSGSSGGTITCPDGTVINSGSTYSVSVPSDTTVQLPNITIYNSSGGTITTIPSVVDYTIPDVSWTDSTLSAQTSVYGSSIVCTPQITDLTITIEVSTGDDTSLFTINSNSAGYINTLDAGGLTITDLQVNAESVNVPFTVVNTDVITIIYSTAAANTVIIMTGTY
jgi:hypothetical protein